MVIIEVEINLTKTGITIRIIYLSNQLKDTVSIGSVTIIIEAILLSILTFIINNIIRVNIIKDRIVNIIKVILDIIRIGNITTKTNRIIRIIVVTRITTRTNRITSKTVNKAANNAEDLALRPV